MKRCNNCNKFILFSSDYCPHCGNELTNKIEKKKTNFLCISCGEPFSPFRFCCPQCGAIQMGDDYETISISNLKRELDKIEHQSEKKKAKGNYDMDSSAGTYDKCTKCIQSLSISYTKKELLEFFTLASKHVNPFYLNDQNRNNSRSKYAQSAKQYTLAWYSKINEYYSVAKEKYGNDSDFYVITNIYNELTKRIETRIVNSVHTRKPKMNKSIFGLALLLILGWGGLTMSSTDLSSEHIKQNITVDDVTTEIPIEDTNSVISEVIKAPVASYDCEGKKYDEVEAIFSNAGFKVLLNKVEQNEGESSYEEGDIISVVAGEKTVFEQDEEITSDTEITISYCALMNASEQTKQQTVEEETKPSYSITDMTATMYAKSTANVRKEPDINSSKLGTLSKNDVVNITGIVDNGWYKINYVGADGYVRSDLLTEEKEAIQAPAVTQPSVNTGNDGGSKGGSSNGGGSGVTVPSVGDTQGNLVWVPTNGGKKYHSRSSCSNMDSPIQVTIEHAEINGFTPCKRCYK